MKFCTLRGLKQLGQNFTPKDDRVWRTVLCSNPCCRHSSSVQRWLCPCKSAWRSCRMHSSWLLHTNVAAEHAFFKGPCNNYTAKKGLKRTISSLDFLCNPKIASDLLAANYKRPRKGQISFWASRCPFSATFEALKTGIFVHHSRTVVNQKKTTSGSQMITSKHLFRDQNRCQFPVLAVSLLPALCTLENEQLL